MNKIVIVNGFTLLTHSPGMLSDPLQHGLIMLQQIQGIAKERDAAIVCIGAVEMGRNMSARAATVLHRIFSETQRPWLFCAEGDDHIALQIASIYGQANLLRENDICSMDELVLGGASDGILVRAKSALFRVHAASENEITQRGDGAISVSLAPYWMRSESDPLPHCAILDTTASGVVELVPIVSRGQLPVFGCSTPEKTNNSPLDGLIAALGAKGVNRLLLSDSHALQLHISKHFTNVKKEKPMSVFAEETIHALMANAIAEQFAQQP